MLPNYHKRCDCIMLWADALWTWWMEVRPTDQVLVEKRDRNEQNLTERGGNRALCVKKF